MENFLLIVSYFIGSISFIIGLKMLSHPESARKGNMLAAAGMIIAILATIFLYKDGQGNSLGNYLWIFGGLIIGTVLGTYAARKVQMTAMPQMVSLFNGMGGACAAIISIVEFQHLLHSGSSLHENLGQTITILLGLVIGIVSFAGSMVAFGKLNGNINDRTLPLGQIINIALLIGIGILTYLVCHATGADANTLFYSLLIVSAIYGVLFVMPIGGADMPVVISLLNSFTGVAAALGGFLYDNYAMLTGGILVGSAGTLLTILMCKAMNRSLLNVVVGSFGGNKTAGNGLSGSGGTYKEISISDTAVLMMYSKKVIIVPGYGLAVAQAQHICHELEKVLEENGVEVKYAIHPVAGRMPGHMNVLLAEADVSYDKLADMDDVNPEFSQTDVVLVLGANDVVNPAAKTDPSSPIYGMPILDVESATHIIVNKRSMKPGYAGIENELFFRPKTSMLFGDAKDCLQKLVTEMKNL
jgi:NAD(P) transhydrogenase subunit beta